jgi:glycosyltransferase involved in cell wall biosynthesis
MINMRRPLVTIAILTYNRASSYLREALTSALSQTYQPLEIIVADNGSTDETAALVARMSDERVRYFRHDRNIGANANSNFCIEKARGEYFLLLHDDDRVDPDFVEQCMSALDRCQWTELPGLIRTGTRVIDAQGRIQSERANQAQSQTVADLILSWFAGKTSLYLCSTLYHTQSLREIGGFKSKHDLYEDVVATVRIAGRRPILDVPDVKASFRRHGGNAGGVAFIRAWCEDSYYLLEVMCEVARAEAKTIRKKGLIYFTRNNYSRVARLNSLPKRIQGYWHVYRFFGHQYSPVRFIAYRNYQRLRTRFSGRRCQ